MAVSEFDAAPGAALDRLQSHDGLVLVDLDETLYLRNSTEDFLDSVRPALLAFLLLKLLDVLRPWRLTGGIGTRDVWRVGTMMVLLPWSGFLWRRAALRLGPLHVNRELAAVFAASRQPKAIVTLGFRPIVAPLVAAMGFPDVRVIAMSCWHFAERRDGKRTRVENVLGNLALSRALVVTDSLDDRDLLERAEIPMRVIWPEARFIPAFRDVYLPGLYITRVKRPNVRYIYRGIVSDEFSIWVLASFMLATQPLLHVAGLALMSISFWAIYETGYVDNDRVGARHEKDPALSKEFHAHKGRFPTVQPWLWALGCGIAGLYVLRWPDTPLLLHGLVWAGVLLFTFGWFRLYNRLDKQTRIWFFAGLQILRSMSFTAVVAVTPVGAAALVAHAMARWVPYYQYRVIGGVYRDDHVGMTRLLFFMVISGSVGIVVGWQAVWTPVEFILLAWLTFKARRELLRAARGMRWITRRPPLEPAEGKGRAPAGGRGPARALR